MTGGVAGAVTGRLGVRFDGLEGRVACGEPTTLELGRKPTVRSWNAPAAARPAEQRRTRRGLWTALFEALQATGARWRAGDEEAWAAAGATHATTGIIRASTAILRLEGERSTTPLVGGRRAT